MNKEKQGKKLRFNLKSNPIMGVLIPLIFIMLVTQIFNHNFLTGANLSSILKSIPFLALATLGASFPLLIGEIDISVGRIAGLCGMFFSLLFVVYNLPLPVSILCALALGLVIGFVNAFLVVKIGMSSFIATMGTLYICGGLRYLVNGGTVMTLPTEMRSFSQATPLGISWFFWIVLAIYAIVAFLQRKTAFGRYFYAVGNNADVSQLQGVNVKRVKVAAYLISGVLSAAAGVMATIDINSAQPSTGTNWEFKAVAACVVGRREPDRRCRQRGRRRLGYFRCVCHQQHHQYDRPVQLLGGCLYRLHSCRRGYDRHYPSAPEDPRIRRTSQ